MPTLRFSTLTILVVLSAGLLLMGQKAVAPQAAQARSHAAAGADAHLQMLSQKLNLTDDQKTELKPILKVQEQQLKAIYGDTSLSPEQKAAKKKSLHESFLEQINAVLTPEQQAKLK
jgi:Spy/CpxP family protein refolding chaperone